MVSSCDVNCIMLLCHKSCSIPPVVTVNAESLNNVNHFLVYLSLMFM